MIVSGSATRVRGPLVFLSHSSIDAVDADRVAQELEQHGVNVWLAKHDMSSGSTYAAEITERIEGCDAFCLLLSPDSMLSPHVAREMNLALESDRLVVPVTRHAELLDPKLLLPQWRYWLGTVQITVLSSNLNELAAIAADLGGCAESEHPDTPTAGQPPSPSSSGPAARVQNQVKAMVIRSGLRGVTMGEILQQSRRLHLDPAVVRDSVIALRNANLIAFVGDLTDETVIQLT